MPLRMAADSPWCSHTHDGPLPRADEIGASPSAGGATRAICVPIATRNDRSAEQMGLVGVMAMILWARHGQNIANLTGTFSHRIFDGELTSTGRQQAEALAGHLASFSGAPIGQLICSPLRRARQTAQIIGSRLGLPVACELDDLRELNVGALDGRSDPAAWDTYAAVLAAWKQGQARTRFPGGENRDELCARLRRALAVAARTSPAATTLIVAHGASLRAALPGLTGRPDPGADMPTGTVAALQVDTGPSAPAIRLLSWPEERA